MGFVDWVTFMGQWSGILSKVKEDIQMTRLMKLIILKITNIILEDHKCN